MAYPVNDGFSSPRPVLRSLVAALGARETLGYRVERAVAA